MVAAGAHPYSRVGTLGRVPMSLTVRVEGRWAWSGRTVSYRAVLELRCVPLRAPVPYQTKKAFYRKFSRFSDRQVARAIAEGECRVRCPVECRALYCCAYCCRRLYSAVLLYCSTSRGHRASPMYCPIQQFSQRTSVT